MYDHSQGIYFPPKRRRSIVFRGCFQQTNKPTKGGGRSLRGPRSIADSPQKYIWTCIYTYTYTHMHVHIHTHTCIHIYMYTYTYTYTYIHTWIHIHTHTHIHVHIHIYIYKCLCTHICVYIYIYRICTSCREREANVYADVHNIYLT